MHRALAIRKAEIIRAGQIQDSILYSEEIIKINNNYDNNVKSMTSFNNERYYILLTLTLINNLSSEKLEKILDLTDYEYIKPLIACNLIKLNNEIISNI